MGHHHQHSRVYGRRGLVTVVFSTDHYCCCMDLILVRNQFVLVIFLHVTENEGNKEFHRRRGRRVRQKNDHLLDVGGCSICIDCVFMNKPMVISPRKLVKHNIYV